MSNSRYDKLLKNKVQEAFQEEHIEYPNKELAWFKIQKELEIEHLKKRRKNRWKKYGSLVVAMVLLISLLSNPTGSSAFSSFIKTVEKWKDEVIELIIYRSEKGIPEGAALTVPPPDEEKHNYNKDNLDNNISTPIEVTIEEAYDLLAFPLIEPNDVIVDQYELILVELMYDQIDAIYYKLEMTYTNETNWFSIFQEKLPENVSRTLRYDTETTEVKQIKLGHLNGHLINFPEHNTIRLEWIKNDISIMIHGNIFEEQILSIANSMVP